MSMVMLSQPTPPVSELEARQLSIMFSQIFSSSCLAAIPLRTNSTTAWEDWQSQIPASISSTPHTQNTRSLTVTGENKKLIFVGEIVLLNIGEGGHNLVLG